MKKIAFLAAAAAVAMASPALATQYLVNVAGNGVSASGFITTDSTIGVIGQSNITDWEFLLNDGSSTFTIDDGNSQVLVQGSELTATATTLSFNFSGFGLALFQNPNIGSGRNFICFVGNGVCGGAGNRISISVDRFGGGIAQTGVQVIGQASVAVVPEPATWAMMIAGFGLAGAAIRRRTVRSAAA